MKSESSGSTAAGSLVDRDLERLVEELNATRKRGAEPSPSPCPPPDTPSIERVFEGRGSAAGTPFSALLQEMARHGASDLHLICGLPRALRIDGELHAVSESVDVTAAELRQLLAPHLGPEHRKTLEHRGSVDLSLTAPLEDGERARFRINVHRQRGLPAVAVRMLPVRIPSLGELGLPTSLTTLVEAQQGLVVVCGPTGAGKTTTLAALVGEINRRRRAHVITIEDPVEYEHVAQGSFIEHVEIGRDAPSFAAALRSSLRQDPDVIMVGEIRDLETISTALTAAETGHLILTSVHSNDGVQALHRLVDVFPAGAQSQIRQQLALSLHGIVSQRLLPRSDGQGRVAAIERLVPTGAVRRLIRDDAVDKLYNEVTLGKRHGMVSMEASLADLVRRGVVSEAEARSRSTRPDELASLLRTGAPPL